jgi:hypothetical protein
MDNVHGIPLYHHTKPLSHFFSSTLHCHYLYNCKQANKDVMQHINIIWGQNFPWDRCCIMPCNYLLIQLYPMLHESKPIHKDFIRYFVFPNLTHYKINIWIPCVKYSLHVQQTVALFRTHVMSQKFQQQHSDINYIHTCKI